MTESMASGASSVGKKRVLHVTHNMAVGGAEVVIKHLIQSLDRERYINQVVCIDGVIGELGNALAANGVRIHCLSRKPGFDTALISQLKALVKQERIDVLHCHQYTPFTYGVISALMTGVRVIFTEHGRLYPDTWSWKRRVVNQFLQRRACSIVAISESTRDALVEYEWFSRRRIGIVYNGITSLLDAKVDKSVEANLGLSSADMVIGTVSRLDSIKNQALMVAAFARVVHEFPNAKLLLIGDGPERENLESQIASLNIESNVVISGFVHDVVSHLSIVDVFLLTSFSEGTSMALLEAMSLAKPIIATRVGGNTELLSHEETALLIDSDDEEGLSKCLRKLLSDAQLRTQLGNRAQSRFNENFDVSQMVLQYERLYSD